MARIAGLVEYRSCVWVKIFGGKGKVGRPSLYPAADFYSSWLSFLKAGK